MTETHYRLLNPTEIIQDGDEYRDAGDNGEWCLCAAEDFGITVSDSAYDMVRRPVDKP